MAAIIFLCYLTFTLITLYNEWKAYLWEAGSVIYLITASFYVGMPWWANLMLWTVILAADVVIRVPNIQNWMTDLMYKKAIKSVPKLSKTEEEALNAGDTWLEQDIFRGEPNWKRLSEIKATLTEEEQAFLDNQTQTLCSMLDEWDIDCTLDLSSPVWNYMKKEGFFGLVIPKEYGGKGFSARAHSDIVFKLASRSGAAAVTVMVPNSLGPGELLNYYGTKEQKKFYLPRLAKGEDIPCFALTEPNAGSDATSIQAEAIVKKKSVNGQSVLGLELTFDKRWITLAPIATLIGLAVNLRDPEGLLKNEGEEGITCVLIPRDTEGLEIGNRHLPANQPFMNGTLRGHQLFVPIDAIIGGQKNAGKGWQMLVECLSIGRSISLPALGAASSSVSYLTAGAFAKIRKQFGVDIAQFEGIQEKLAEIAGINYLINGTRLLTLAAVDEHKKPSVASAITKYFNTENARICVNHSMDVHAGRAVVTGPRNYMYDLYQGLPIAITVEGANIMSRNLLIFGQGSMACHPYIREEFYAISKEDKAAFSVVIWKHIHYFLRNFARAFCSAWTGGLFISAPHGALHRQYKKLTRLSHAFAWIADLSLMTLGGNLKRKESLSARLADGMSYLYQAMGSLRLQATHAADQSETLHALWATDYCYYQAQKALLDLCRNFPIRPLGWLMRFVAFPMGQSMHYPKDSVRFKLASAMTSNNTYRETLKKWVYLSGDSSQPIDRMENTLQLIMQNELLYKKVNHLRGVGAKDLMVNLEERIAKGELTKEEMNTIVEVEKARWDAILVDEFAFKTMKGELIPSVIASVPSPFKKDKASESKKEKETSKV